MEPIVATKEDLLAEFQTDEDSCFESGRLNNVTDIALTMVAVVGSLTATVLATTTPYRWLAAAFAALPAACTSLQQIVDFRGRSVWYFGHAASLKGLAVSLRYAANPDLESYARHRADLELEAEKRWAQVGRGGVDRQTRK